MRYFTERLRAVSLVTLLSGLGAAAVQADEEGVIKYRQGIMKAQGGYMGAMGMVVQGRADYTSNLTDHAQGLYRLVTLIPTLFPPGSDFGETDALERIWSNSDDFEAKAADTEKAAASLVKAAESGDRGAIGEAYRALGQTCKGCHEEYRRKRN